MMYLKAFLVGGIICALSQVLIDRTRLTPFPTAPSCAGVVFRRGPPRSEVSTGSSMVRPRLAGMLDRVRTKRDYEGSKNATCLISPRLN